MRFRNLIILLIVATSLSVGMFYAGTFASLTPQGHEHRKDEKKLGAMRGRVIDAEGRLIPGAEVYADKSDAATGKRPFTLTDGQGFFSFEQLAPGTYTLSSAKQAEGYPPTDSPFHTGAAVNLPLVDVDEQQITDDLVIHLGSKAAKIEVRLVDAKTKRSIRNQQNIELTLRRVDNPDYAYTTGPNLKGNFTVLVPPVPFIVEVSVPGYEKRRLHHSTLNSGELKKLTVSLQPAK